MPPSSAGELRGSSALRRPLRRREGRGTSPARSWRVDRLVLGLRSSVTSASAVVTAAANKDALDLLWLASSVGIRGGSGCSRSGRGCCGGGGNLVEDFVLWLRRRGGACSGVVVEPRSFSRSASEEVGGQEGLWWSAGRTGAGWIRRQSPADVPRSIRSSFWLVDLAAHNACRQGVLLLQVVDSKVSFFHLCNGDVFGFFLVERLKKMFLILCFLMYLLLCSCSSCILSLL